MKHPNRLLLLIVVVGCFAIAAFVYSISIVYDDIKGTKGDPGKNGANGTNGFPGEIGLQGNSVQATCISKINVTNNQTLSLFSQNSPTSSNQILANTVKIGDVMTVDVNFETFPLSEGGNATINFACTSGQLMNLVLSDNATQTFFQVKLIVTFNTLNTVNIFYNNTIIENVPFDTTMNQFLSLTLNAQNITACSVYNFIISRQTSA